MGSSGCRSTTVVEYSYDGAIDVDFIVGHLRSAMSATTKFLIPTKRR